MKYIASFFLIFAIVTVFGSFSDVDARPPLSLEVVSVSSEGFQGNDHSFLANIGHDGRYVVFHSYATNLSESDTDDLVGVYLRDRINGTTIYIATYETPTGDDPVPSPQLSGNNDWVGFSSFARLDSSDTDGNEDTYLYNISTGTFELVSTIASGNAGNVSLSYDACSVVYDDNLQNVYLYDRITGTSQLIGSGGLDPHISADGNYVVYTTFSGRSLQLYDRTTDTITQIEVSSVYSPVISANGNVIVYERRINSTSSNIVAYNRISGSYTILTNYQSGSLGRSFDASVTADGSWVVFGSFASDLVPGPDTVSADIFAYEMATGAIERLSLLPDGTEPNSRTDIPSISGDGRHVIFQSYASNYVAPDTNGFISDVFVGDYGLVSSPIGTPTENCTVSPIAPVYSSDPVPDSTVTLIGAPGTIQSTTIDISNIGDAGSLLDVTQVGTLTNFTITGGLPINDLTPADGAQPVTIECTVPTSAEPLTEILTLQSNEVNSPVYSYNLECLNDVSPDTDTPTPTSTATSTATNTATNTPTSTATNTPTNTSTNTPTSTATNTPTNTSTNTPTSTATNTTTNTPTSTPTNTPTGTPQSVGCQAQHPNRLDCSSLEVTAICEGTTVVFTIRNTGEPGNGDMVQPTEYRIFEEDVFVTSVL